MTWIHGPLEIKRGDSGEDKGVEFPKKRSWGLERSTLVHQNHLLHQPRRPGERKRHRFLHWCLHLQNLAFVGFLGAGNRDIDGGKACQGVMGRATRGDDIGECVSRLELGKNWVWIILSLLIDWLLRNPKHWSGKRKLGRFYKNRLWIDFSNMVFTKGART